MRFFMNWKIIFEKKCQVLEFSIIYRMTKGKWQKTKVDEVCCP